MATGVHADEKQLNKEIIGEPKEKNLCVYLCSVWKVGGMWKNWIKVQMRESGRTPFMRMRRKAENRESQIGEMER